jgi:hypothetical protein
VATRLAVVAHLERSASRNHAHEGVSEFHESATTTSLHLGSLDSDQDDHDEIILSDQLHGSCGDAGHMHLSV